MGPSGFKFYGRWRIGEDFGLLCAKLRSIPKAISCWYSVRMWCLYGHAFSNYCVVSVARLYHYNNYYFLIKTITTQLTKGTQLSLLCQVTRVDPQIGVKIYEMNFCVWVCRFLCIYLQKNLSYLNFHPHSTQIA